MSTEGTVKNRAAFLNQNQAMVIRAAPPPVLKKKPAMIPNKENNGSTMNNVTLDLGSQTNGVNSTSPAKRYTPPTGSFPGMMPAVQSSGIAEARNRLKKTPPPKLPVTQGASKETPFSRRPSLNKPRVKPKPPLPSPTGNRPASSTESTKDSISRSDVDSTSLSSFTSESSLPRTLSSTSRTESSASHRTSGKPELQILPPQEVLGNAPVKPSKPPTGMINLPSPTALPKLANKRSSFLYKKTVRVPPPSPLAVEVDDEVYDDVDHVVSNERPMSLIPTMDSDDEEQEDEIYDDTDVPPPLSIGGRLPPSLPPMTSIPHLPPSHSPLPSTPENSGGGDFGDIYDDVSNPDPDAEELYEALDNDLVEDLRTGGDRVSELSAGMDDSVQELSIKEKDAQKKKEEKLRKEQEKQQKKEEKKKKDEEERREKEKQRKDREDKKRREKEEKDAKKKFNIKGEIQVIDVGTVTTDAHVEYADKLDLAATKGEHLEILRREGNPTGKWLVRDTNGTYGYIEQQFVAVEGDSQEVYDDVAAIEPETEEIYDLVADH